MSAGSMMQLSGFVSLSWNSDSDTLHLSTHKEIHTGYKQLDLVEVVLALVLEQRGQPDDL